MSRPFRVSLTFDDALPEHLDVAVPMLERHQLRASFYVDVGSEYFCSRMQDWTAVAKRGHELGNHTVFHPGVSSKPWVTPGIALDDYCLDRMRHELMVANRILQAIDGRTTRSFAFPCSNPWLGRPGWPRRVLTRLGLERTRIMGFVDRHRLDLGSQLMDYTPLVRELFPAARCGGIAPDSLQILPEDWHRVHALDGDGADLTALRSALETALGRSRWAVFVFHGVGGGHRLNVERETFASFCADLANDPRVEVLPFIDAALRLGAKEPRLA